MRARVHLFAEISKTSNTNSCINSPLHEFPYTFPHELLCVTANYRIITTYLLRTAVLLLYNHEELLRITMNYYRTTMNYLIIPMNCYESLWIPIFPWGFLHFPRDSCSPLPLPAWRARKKYPCASRPGPVPECPGPGTPKAGINA